ncbi:MAG: N-acetylmuramoyl-L-alanine amidase [Candidatus Omnitrophica bacterium]|nr:N-acetylmuramoyl-L-alanine amidase [Candidatus Omnitrophota bacterium]
MPRKYFFILSAILTLTSAGCATVGRKTLAPPAISPAQGVYHIVTPGQTLWRIAHTYNIDVNELMRLNGITDPSQLIVGQRLLIRRAACPLPMGPVSPVITSEVEAIVGPKHYSSHWRTITLHHSGTIEGNAGAFDRNHRKRGMGGLFYHFVIGNGAGSGDGQIEVGWRWRKQANANRPKDIQICLVGDFNRQRLSESQFESLIKLITVLRRQYNIPVSNIRKHKSIRGKHTACPGSSFPFGRIILQLRQIKA